MNVIDADGHVTETQEQIAKYLDEPYKRRPINQFFFPWDGWDRRLLNTFNDLASTCEAWERALDKGGMEKAVLYPTLGLFMSFLKDRQWAVAICRAYNTFLHEEFIKKSKKKKPSEYCRSGNIYFSCEADEWLLPQAVKLIGENQIVYASDFPHWDHSWPASIDEIRQRGDINDTQKQKILAGAAPVLSTYPRISTKRNSTGLMRRGGWCLLRRRAPRAFAGARRVRRRSQRVRRA